jgi:hypothetical protein
LKSPIAARSNSADMEWTMFIILSVADDDDAVPEDCLFDRKSLPNEDLDEDEARRSRCCRRRHHHERILS